jgi:hypothetical protein
VLQLFTADGRLRRGRQRLRLHTGRRADGVGDFGGGGGGGDGGRAPRVVLSKDGREPPSLSFVEQSAGKTYTHIYKVAMRSRRSTQPLPFAVAAAAAALAYSPVTHGNAPSTTSGDPDPRDALSYLLHLRKQHARAHVASVTWLDRLAFAHLDTLEDEVSVAQ